MSDDLTALLRASIAAVDRKRGNTLTLVHEHGDGDDEACSACVRLSVEDRALMSRAIAAGEAMACMVAPLNEDAE